MIITREKAKLDENWCDTITKTFFNNQIDLIYDSFEQREIFLATKDVLCNDCIYYLSDNGNYPLEPCSECSRFYADNFERKAIKEG